MGPTAVGKSAIAMEVALRTGATILSVDSMQVYRGMDIGTAKPVEEDLAEVRHLMIDVADPDDDFTVAEFQATARAALADVDTPVLIVGGSGLHFRAVVDPLEFPPSDAAVRSAVETVPDDDLVAELRSADPVADAVVDLQNRRRLVRAVEILRLTGLTPTMRRESEEAKAVRHYRSHLPVTIFGIDRRTDLGDRVRERVSDMRRRGLLAEVAGLRNRLGGQASRAVGYKELIPVVDGIEEADEAFEAIVRSTNRLVKRQRTYFRPDPRIRWFEASEGGLVESISKEVERGVSSWTS